VTAGELSHRIALVDRGRHSSLSARSNNADRLMIWNRLVLDFEPRRMLAVSMGPTSSPPRDGAFRHRSRPARSNTSYMIKRDLIDAQRRFRVTRDARSDLRIDAEHGRPQSTAIRGQTTGRGRPRRQAPRRGRERCGRFLWRVA
jgi:hypothetical protein